MTLTMKPYKKLVDARERALDAAKDWYYQMDRAGHSHPETDDELFVAVGALIKAEAK